MGARLPPTRSSSRAGAALLREGPGDVLAGGRLRPPQEGRLHHARDPLVPARARAVLQGLLRSPSFTAGKYWDGRPSPTRSGACDGEVEESKFFWRAINAEVWMRVFFDDHDHRVTTTATPRRFRPSAVTHASARVARGAARAAVREAQPGQTICSCRPATTRRPWFLLKSRLIHAGRRRRRTRSSRPVDRCRRHASRRRRPRAREREGLSISQGNASPVADIRTSRAARLLSRFRSRTPVGVGLGHPATMQLAIDEVAVPSHPPRRRRGRGDTPVRHARRFYRVAGWTGERDRRAVDGQPPSLRHLGVQGADRLRRRGDPDRERIVARTGRKVDVAIIDANDLARRGVRHYRRGRRGNRAALVVDNPLGQSAEQTPFGLVRTLV